MKVGEKYIMGKILNEDYVTNKQPLYNYDNREENILIETPGIIIPECDEIIYGLLFSKYSSAFEKLRNLNRINPKTLYYETAFFHKFDLLRHLANDDEKKRLEDPAYCNELLQVAHEQYLCEPCGETMIRHAFIELAYQPFIKTVTFLYPYEIRDIDMQYLSTIIPKSIREKFFFVSGNLLDIVEENHELPKTDFSYTTIVTNSLSDILSLLENPKKYPVKSTCFLLRNHSGNMEICETIDTVTKQPKIIFREKYTKEILERMVDIETGIPITENRFGRFEPTLFIDMKPTQNPFELIY